MDGVVVVESFAALALCTEGQCLTCRMWATIRSKINARALGVVQLARHEDGTGRWCSGDQARNLRNPVHVPPFIPGFDRAQAAAALAEMSKVMQSLTNGPATMAATPIKEDTRVDTQTQELRLRLRNARAERELKIKTDNADAIVTRLDSLPAGAIVRFVKPYAATGSKPAGEYTYVAIKPVDGARWYTTGCDANPMLSDDLASFMVGAESVTSWDVLGDASETFQVPDVTASDTPAETATDAGK
jgi:hypothetical protein